MARKRLSPLGGSWEMDATREGEAGSGAGARPPIARVAGDAASAAALEEMAGALERARAEGRMVLELPLAAIEAQYQSRDRVLAEAGAMEELKESLRARGQQAPIEVVELPSASRNAAPRYGLISGWRRLRALGELQAETGEARFGTVLALLRRPQDRAAAYVAMVEENEVRADLSFYERAHVVAQSLADGVFATEKQALHALFATASYGKRSKIKSFLPVVAELGAALRFPTAIPERLGLMLARALDEPTNAWRLRAALADAAPETPEAEAAVLAAALERLLPRPEAMAVEDEGTREEGTQDEREAPALPPQAAPSTGRPVAPPRAPAVLPPVERMSDPYLIAPGIRFSARRGRVELEGEGVSPGMIERLQDWLRAQR
ncbi:ParB N-terminal domain-containing protein [Frigidibacter sp. MR17.14]|uniref:ParB/RepB/Spo0J family partition protein n=1 Tax=Frigidibacter sp. MR17.14 TaxID=3126509 RepID=UPI003012D862